uniref:Uncharacterized protein n=1 Tax=Ignisphaera aggregans TaxID=334771 RepID=A0A7J2U557_9CREN
MEQDFYSNQPQNNTLLQLKASLFKAEMKRKDCKELLYWFAGGCPKHMDAGLATTKQIHYMGRYLTTPTALQMTDVNPNRCGEPMNRPKRALAL